MITSAGELNYRDLAAAGANSFTWIARIQIVLICVLAPVFMGGAIAQEASPRTWEVLLTTPMTAHEIVLGNLFGRLFFVLALLVASLPLFALTQFFGGVPGSAILASYVVAACAALLVGSIAIALSVSRLVGKRAFFVFYVAIVSYLAITIAIDVLLGGIGTGGIGVAGNVTWMTALNPFLALQALIAPATFARAPEGAHTGLARWFLEKPVTTWCVGSALVSLFFIVASTVTVRVGGLHTFGQESGGIPWYRRLMGLGAATSEHRPPRTVWVNPIAWREAAARNATLGKILLRWAFLAAGAAFGIGLIVMFHRGSMDAPTFQFALAATITGELAVIALVALNSSATAISREREDGTLDILLTTPLTARAYLLGKLRGLITFLLPLLAIPFCTLLLAGLYVLVGGFDRTGGVEIQTVSGGAPLSLPVVLPEAGLLVPIVIIPFMAFCVMVGLQWSLKSRGTLGSVIGSVGVVGVVAGIVGLCAWNAGDEIPLVGPVVSQLSPVSAVVNVIYPGDRLRETIVQSEFGGARVSLIVGAVVSAGIYAAICYGILASMVRGFDMTVRKLAGTR